MRTCALLERRKADICAMGMRQPEVNFRLWSMRHHPFVDAAIGGIAALVRCDDLHITMLGTAKKLYEDLKLLLHLTYGKARALEIVEAEFNRIQLPRISSVAKLRAV